MRKQYEIGHDENVILRGMFLRQKNLKGGPLDPDPFITLPNLIIYKTPPF